MKQVLKLTEKDLTITIKNIKLSGNKDVNVGVISAGKQNPNGKQHMKILELKNTICKIKKFLEVPSHR